MKKILIFLVVASMIVSPNLAFAQNYLLTDKNYYSDNTVAKWFLDEKITAANVGVDIFNSLKDSANRNLVIFSEGMTFNEYYLKNNISPEDNFYRKRDRAEQIVELRPGVFLNSLPTADYPVTYVWPTDTRGGAYWGWPVTNKPKTFARLTVGELPLINPEIQANKLHNYNNYEGKLSQFSRDSYLFPSHIGYGEKATANDYMLTTANDFRIPARYNEKRDDVFLTMRSQAAFGDGIPSAQVYLTAKDAQNNAVKPESEDNKFFINATANIFMTHWTWDQLGTVSKGMVVGHKPNNSLGWDQLYGGFGEMLQLWSYDNYESQGAFPLYSNTSKKLLTNIGVSSLATALNNGMREIQGQSSADTIVGGNGGQIQLTGFYRKSNIDNNFSASHTERQNDASHFVNVEYYMYTTNSRETQRPRNRNRHRLYSPNESTFKIETTRPFFKNFWDTTTEILFDENTFNTMLGLDSFEIEDMGISKKTWNAISVDEGRVRARISEDNGQNYSSEKYTMSELKAKLEALTQDENNIGKTFTIAYVYAATDSQDANIWLLPTEIKDDTGAYAVPFVRNVYIPAKVIVKYLDENDNEFAASEEKILWKIGDDYVTIQKDFTDYVFEKIKDNELGNGVFKKWNRTIVYKYKKQTGKIIVKHVDEAGNEIENEVREEKLWDAYTVSEKNIPGYEFVKIKDGDVRTGNFEKTEKTITFEYKKLPETGKVIAKYVDENGVEIAQSEEKTGKVWEKFEIFEKIFPDYEFVKIFDGDSANGKFTEEDQTVRFVYKKIIKNVEPPKVTVKYFDENNREIAREMILTGKDGEEFSTKSIDIVGYTFVKIFDGDVEKGKFSDTPQMVRYIYKKISQNNSGNGGGGPGGYVALTPVKETTQAKPITTADNQNIFKTGNIGGQCVSIVKNLDEPRLVDYYTSILDINSSREVHTAVSRGEFMKMLFLASGLDISNIAIRTDIADVDANNPYARYISAGLHYGLVHGQTDGTNLYFRPNDSLSRAESAKIFIRAANLGTSSFSGIFSDVAQSLTLSEYIESAYNNCLLHGRKTLNGQPMDGKPRVFEPYSSITIAETAKVLYNMTH